MKIDINVVWAEALEELKQILIESGAVKPQVTDEQLTKAVLKAVQLMVLTSVVATRFVALSELLEGKDAA